MAGAAEVLGTDWVLRVFVSIQWGWVVCLASYIASLFCFWSSLSGTSKHQMILVFRSSKLATLLPRSPDLRETVLNSHNTGSGDSEAPECWAESPFVRLTLGQGRPFLLRTVVMLLDQSKSRDLSSSKLFVLSQVRLLSKAKRPILLGHQPTVLTIYLHMGFKRKAKWKSRFDVTIPGSFVGKHTVVVVPGK